MTSENVPPRNPHHILELSDDGAAASCPKKVTGPSKSTKQPKAKPILVESSDSDDDSDQVNANNKKTNIRDSDSDNEKPSESPEEELGKLSTTIVAYFMITYQNYNLKNEWPKIGPHPFTDFSIRVPQLKLSTVVVATSFNAPHLFAKERARGPGS
jgi:hypothetical protein